MRPKHINRILIGIQARSTSKRFPGKTSALIGGIPMLDLVLNSVEESLSFLRRNLKDQVDFNTVLLIPEGDKLKRYQSRVVVWEGDEDNVLSRYQKAFAFYRPDYVVRITADCPMLPDFVISKHIRSALYSDCDYICNCNPIYRTTLDGWDCEVISKRLMKWLFEVATTPYDLEHVTSLIRKCPPEWAKLGHVIDHIDHSDIKLSVDTQEDLDRVREAYERREQKLMAAKLANMVIFRL